MHIKNKFKFFFTDAEKDLQKFYCETKDYPVAFSTGL